jgi:Peptidase S24-like
MSPLIRDGCILAVDSSQSDQTQLNGKIVIAWQKDRGLTVSCLRRFDHTEVLEPENHEYESITISAKAPVGDSRQSALVDSKGSISDCFSDSMSDQASTQERQYRGTRKKYVRTLLFLLHVTSSPYSGSGWLLRELKALQVIAPLLERSHGRPGQ